MKGETKKNSVRSLNLNWGGQSELPVLVYSYCCGGVIQSLESMANIEGSLNAM